MNRPHSRSMALQRLTPLAAAITLALCACSTVKVEVPPVAVTVPQRFHYRADMNKPVVPSTSASGAPAAAPASLPAPQASGKPLQQWWLEFHDPVLTAYVEQGLQANTDVRIALDRIREARAYAVQARSALYPNLDAGGLWAHEKYKQHNPQIPSTVLLPNPEVPMVREYAGGFLASWEVDIFGARRSKANSVDELVGGASELVHGAQLMVAGDIATNYLEARGIERRMLVLEKGIAMTQRLVNYATARYKAGQTHRADVLRAQAEAAYTESQWAPLRMMLHQHLHRLATLTGQVAQQISELPPLPAGAGVPEDLPHVLPSEVLDNRPDVRGAAFKLQSSAQELGEAKAQLFPKFYLGFLAEDGHIHTPSLPNSGGILQVLGLGVRLPIFNAGRLRAQIDAQDARLDAAAADYEHAILQALEDVENAYVARIALDARMDKLILAVQYSTESAQQTEGLYKAGQETLQPALEAYGKAYLREDELVQAQTLRATTTVLLYKAIGSGWSTESTQASLAALDARAHGETPSPAQPTKATSSPPSPAPSVLPPNSQAEPVSPRPTLAADDLAAQPPRALPSSASLPPPPALPRVTQLVVAAPTAADSPRGASAQRGAALTGAWPTGPRSQRPPHEQALTPTRVDTQACTVPASAEDPAVLDDLPAQPGKPPRPGPALRQATGTACGQTSAPTRMKTTEQVTGQEAAHASPLPPARVIARAATRTDPRPTPLVLVQATPELPLNEFEPPSSAGTALPDLGMQVVSSY